MLDTLDSSPVAAMGDVAPDATTGRILAAEEGVARVLTARGVVRAGYSGAVLADMAASRSTPCPGDWCILRSWPGHRMTLECLLPRRTAVTACLAGAEPQVVCANVDLAAVVIAMRPRPEPSRIEPYLAAVRASGARPLLILTKADLVRSPAQDARRLRTAFPGVTVIRTSVVTPGGLARFRRLVPPDLTSVLVGPPGQGRSSLLDALIGANHLPGRAARQRPDGRVRRELVPLPGGGAVIDVSWA